MWHFDRSIIQLIIRKLTEKMPLGADPGNSDKTE